MSRPLLPGLLLALTLAGCARDRVLAPTEMTDIVRYMFLHWEDEEHLGLAFENLELWLEAQVPSEEAVQGFRLDPLTEEDIASVEHPDRPLDGLLGAAGGAESEHPLKDHAWHITLEDQVFSNPKQYKRYDRVVEGDVQAFLDGEGMVRTVNQVETSNFGVSIPYVLMKDYRWVESPSGARAIIARSWVEEPSCSSNGNNCLEHSYSIDHFGARGSASVRFTATWSEVSTGLPLSDKVLVAGLANGLQNVFKATDKYLDEER